MIFQRLVMTRTQAYRQIGLMIAGTGVSYGTSPALCEDKKGILDAILPKNKEGEVEWGKVTSQVTDGAYWDAIMKAVGDKAQGAIDSGVPTQLSYGFISGYCSGMALKKAGRVAAAVFGLGFITIQTLSYKGYLEVDHVKIQKQVEDMLDLNQDGKVDVEDGKVAFEKALSVLQFNMPAGGGFAAGFAGGLRSG